MNKESVEIEEDDLVSKQRYEQKDRGHWIMFDQVFVTYGRCFAIDADLETVCIGPEDDVLKEYRKGAANGSDRADSASEPQETVAKTKGKDNHSSTAIHAKKYATRGRPKRPLPISKIRKLAGKGMSSREITRRLAKDGIAVHHSMIIRVVKEMQVKLSI